MDSYGVSSYKDSFKLLVKAAENGGDFFTMLEGTYKRSQKTFSAADVKSGPMAPPSEKMKAVAGMVGSWTCKGTFVRGPGAKPGDITGRAEIRNVLGGHALVREFEIDPSDTLPMAYKGIAYVIWSPQKNCYLVFGVSNSGEAHVGRMYHQGDSFVFTGTGVSDGTPILSRSVIDFTDDGNGMKVWSEKGIGNSKTFRSFEGEFKKAKQEKKI